MGEQLTVNEWKKKIAPVLDSKKQEFIMLGYPKATNQEIWECLQARVWKGNPTKRLHEVIQDVFHLSTSTYISFLTISAFQEDTDLMASIAALTGERAE
ncbi:post-transcriptional regulator [Ornithinibacillus sp. 4-3]|uniref:Post-transcriptional regulator n=1 Tax=Ornithinibacillus sp. 4-3 TaxID=3231488 RepID=A0AB39HLK5_9BACI